MQISIIRNENRRLVFVLLSYVKSCVSTEMHYIEIK